VNLILELHQKVIALRGYCVANLQTDAMILYSDQHQTLSFRNIMYIYWWVRTNMMTSYEVQGELNYW